MKHFGIPRTTGNKLLNEGKKKRHYLCGVTNKKGEILWAHVKHQKKYQEVLEHIRSKLYD